MYNVELSIELIQHDFIYHCKNIHLFNEKPHWYLVYF